MKQKNAIEDLVLVKNTLEGQKEAFAVLVNRYKKPVYNLAYRIMGNRPDAEDISQEAFLRAYRSLPSFKINFKFFDWLYTITLNAARNEVKKRKVVKIISVDNPGNTGNNFLKREMPDKKPSAQDVLIKKENHEKLLLEVSRLAEKYRIPIVLRCLEERTYEEISGIMGLPLGTVKIRIHRAKQILYDHWKKTKHSAPHNCIS